MQVNSKINSLFKQLGFENSENTFAVIPKNYFFNIHTNEITQAGSLSFRKISLNDVSNKKIIAYIEQGRLVVIDKNNNVLNDAKFVDLLEQLLTFLKSQEAGAVETDKPSKTKQTVVEKFRKLIECNKTPFVQKVLKQLNEIVSKHNKVVAENVEQESHNSKAADEKHRKIIDQILYYLRMDSIKSEAEEKIS